MQIDPSSLKFVAQSVHQAYHLHDTMGWDRCPKSVCVYIRDLLIDAEHELNNKHGYRAGDSGWQTIISWPSYPAGKTPCVPDG